MQRKPRLYSAARQTYRARQRPRSGLAGSATFLFQHKKSGKMVTRLACGRPGPVSVHTPDVCYAGAGFEVERAAPFSSSRPGLAGQSFFTARLVRKRATEQTAQRIFWAWHGARGWEVSDNPRVSFAGRGALFKMYVIREVTGPSESLENDPCVELMETLLPALENRVRLKSRLRVGCGRVFRACSAFDLVLAWR
ncbi:MAG: hypothetical protein U0793_02840 [Gemmataceae bacterium]